MRIGIDLGGTKIEILALDDADREIIRRRIATPRGAYDAIIATLAALVQSVERELGSRGYPGPHPVGIGAPGSIEPASGLARNANSTELNGKPFQRDIEAALHRPVRIANDANCLALSEAIDGAGADAEIVYAMILGTGVGSGIAVHGRILNGANGIAGEIGHNPLPGASLEEASRTAPCFCGRLGCIETFLSGPGFARDYARAARHDHGCGPRTEAPDARDARAIIAACDAGDPAAREALTRYIDRLARVLGGVINLLDPEVIVLGGGMSRVNALYDALPAALLSHVFADQCRTEILPARHGDSSGVRGAAWLWPTGAP
jgi:fructokinase